MVFTVTRRGDTSGIVSVDWMTRDVTATSGSDYVAAAGQIVFDDPAVNEKSITVVVSGDSLFEGDETFLVELFDADGAMIADRQSLATILDDDSVLFFDGFEDGQLEDHWVQDGQNAWFSSSQRAYDGSGSAEVDGPANDATLTVATPIDLSHYRSARFSFGWLIEKAFDAGEYLALDFSPDGLNWTEITRLRGDLDREDIWQAPAQHAEWHYLQ